MSQEAIKGFIPYPCNCRKKIIVYSGTAGKFSSQCPRCKCFAIFDINAMTATQGSVAVGVIRSLIN